MRLLASLLMSSFIVNVASQEGDICGTFASTEQQLPTFFPNGSEPLLGGNPGCTIGNQTDCYCSFVIDGLIDPGPNEPWRWQCGSDKVPFGPKAGKECPEEFPAEGQLCNVTLNPTGFPGDPSCGYSDCGGEATYSATCGCIDLSQLGQGNESVWICLKSGCECPAIEEPPTDAPVDTPSDAPTDGRSLACTLSGGTVSQASCCASVDDFPPTCAPGACGCAPSSSKEVFVCECPEGTCWDGSTCAPVAQQCFMADTDNCQELLANTDEMSCECYSFCNGEFLRCNTVEDQDIVDLLDGCDGAATLGCTRGDMPPTNPPMDPPTDAPVDTPSDAPVAPPLGGDYCTWTPQHGCYSQGRPACCFEDAESCPEEKPPCDVGASYCTWAPNYDCFTAGWPSCCGDDQDPCPQDQPACDVVDGSSYCTDAPDYVCYNSGWPACCHGENEACPEEEPACDHIEGASYCTWSPNYECYTDGWPSCCGDETETCPEEQPGCDISGTSYCTFAPDFTCWSHGWPHCCALASKLCPEEEPGCDHALGRSYCTYAPAYDCYTNGWPSCCGNEMEDCPKETPPCDVSPGPTDAPMEAPTDAPVDAPTDQPVDAPVDAPTDQPVDAPVDAPTDVPTTSGAASFQQVLLSAVLIVTVTAAGAIASY